MHYYQKNIGDYRRDTSHLSLLEHGIYNLFLDTYYLTEKPLCADKEKLMRTHCVRNADEMRAAEVILADFFYLTDLGYEHKRCDVEIEAFHAKSKSASESAKARWARVRCERNANALNPQCDSDANHKPLTINHKPINQPVTHAKDAKFVMHIGWLPSDHVADLARQSGAPLADGELPEFISHWLTQPDTLRTQAEWDKALLQSAKHRKLRAKPVKFDPVAFVNGNHQSSGDSHGRVIEHE